MAKITMYESKKDGRKVLLFDVGEGKVTIQFEDTKEEKEIAESTFKRWYKKIGDVETGELESTPEAHELSKALDKKEKEKEAKTESKTEKVKVEKKVGLIDLMIPVIEKMGGNVELMPNKKNIYIVSLDGIRKGVLSNLSFTMKPKIARSNNVPYDFKKYNHMFKAKIILPETLKEKISRITELIKL